MKKDGKQRFRIKEYVFCDDTLSRVPIIEIAGNKRVLIENHVGIVKYGAEEIKIKVRKGLICIVGTCMEIAFMSKEKLVICGQIEYVRLCNGGSVNATK